MAILVNRTTARSIVFPEDDTSAAKPGAAAVSCSKRQREPYFVKLNLNEKRGKCRHTSVGGDTSHDEGPNSSGQLRTACFFSTRNRDQHPPAQFVNRLVNLPINISRVDDMDIAGARSMRSELLLR